MTQCIHIAPELPPSVGGIADYTAILSRRLVEVTNGSLEPVLVFAGWRKASELDVNFRSVDLSGKCSATALTETIRQVTREFEEQTVVLLEYSGYGYAKRGAPLWLARGLDKACGGADGPPLVTMFHELYATSLKPWTSSFWLTAVQRHVAGWLAQLSTAIVTNRREAVSWLNRYRRLKRVPIRVQPVFSNVGEPQQLPPFSQRLSRAAVFGGGKRKPSIYNKNNRKTRIFLDNLGISKIIDMGPSTGISKPDNLEVSFHGISDSETISNKLLSVSIGILSYPGARLGKSGVAAAFASHGVPFLLFDEDSTPGNTSPYVEKEHFWRWSTINDLHDFKSENILSDVSRKIKSLYMEVMHSVRAAHCFVQIFDEVL